MSAVPVKLAFDDQGALLIDWSDGRQGRLRVGELRDKCPCATCREKRAAPPPAAMSLPVLSAAEAQPLKLLEMKPVGNYAYSLRFSDGHDTGIYTFEFLRELGETAEGSSAPSKR